MIKSFFFYCSFILSFSSLLGRPSELLVIFLSETPYEASLQHHRFFSRGHLLSSNDSSHFYLFEEDPPSFPKREDHQEADILYCDESSHYSLFCSPRKEKEKEVVRANLAIWIDTSASMKNVDFSQSCFRGKMVKRWLTRLERESVLDLRSYDSQWRFSQRQQAGHFTENNISSLFCQNYGGNNKDYLMRSIEEFQGEKLIIVTDISEYTLDFASFLEKNLAEIKGVGVNNNFYAHDLDSL